MKTVDELVDVAVTTGAQLHASGISWAQISLIAVMIHDSANFAANQELLNKLKVELKVV